MSVRTVRATAPVRICDLGGWTDTWFAGHGAVFHIAVRPGVEVRARVVGPPGGGASVVSLETDDIDEPYSFEPADPPGRQPLLEATVAEVGLPAGSWMGPSAAVTVALIGALDVLAGRSRTAHEVAALAHRIETERLGTESGVQDQVAAAFGGINYVEVRSYPDARVIPLSIPEAVWRELERRLVVVSLGRPHVSSEVHARVIARLRESATIGTAELDTLRSAAADGRDAGEHRGAAGDRPRGGAGGIGVEGQRGRWRRRQCHHAPRRRRRRDASRIRRGDRPRRPAVGGHTRPAEQSRPADSVDGVVNRVAEAVTRCGPPVAR